MMAITNAPEVDGFTFKVQAVKDNEAIYKAAIKKLLRLVPKEKLPADKEIDVTAWL
jgi:hypothetical protein